MSKHHFMLSAIVVALGVLAAACDRVGEGEYEVQRPVIGTTTDTVRVPTVNIGTDSHRVVTPDVDVDAPGGRRDTARRQ